MGQFAPGSKYFAFDEEQWGFVCAFGIEDFMRTQMIEYTINGTKYYLVDMEDVLEDQDELDFDLYEFNIAVFTDSVQANIFGPGEW